MAKMKDSRKNTVSRLVQDKIRSLESGVENGSANAVLAKLRRGVGRAPGELPDILGVVLQGIPENYMSSSGYPTKEEWIIYTAITLYALHQQGWSTSRNTEESVSIGKALSLLAAANNDKNSRERMSYRFRMLASSKDMKELAYHLRGTIQLLRGEGIRINYFQLSGDLYDYQFEESRNRMFLRWGQDLFGGNPEEKNGKEEGGSNNEA